jgi:hypothetical protein
MTDNSTNSVLFELQKNLEDLSSAKIQMDEFRYTSTSVVKGIGNIQDNFVKLLTDLEADYKQRVNKLEESLTTFLSTNNEENKSTIEKVVSTTEQTISKGVEQFGIVASKVETSNDEKISAVTKLLEHYKSVVEASRSLIDTLNAIDFPSKLDALSSKTQLIIESITNAKQALELKSNETQTSINDKTTLAKEQIIQNSDTKFHSLTELVNNSKEILSKTVSDNLHEHAAQSKTSFESINNLLKENITQINQRHDKQEKELNLLKMFAIAITVISFIGITVTILILKKWL